MSVETETKTQTAGSFRARWRRHRLWVPTGAVLLTGIALGAAQWQGVLERNLTAWLTLGLVLLGLLLLWLWFLLLSRFPWRLRLGVTAALVLGGIGFSQLVRVDGTASSLGLPHFVWRFSAAEPVRLDDAPTRTPPAPAAGAAAIPDVPQFLGPQRDGLVPGVKLARDWQARPPKLLWRQPIGAGWSSFAVAGGRAFTQEQRGTGECVTCYQVLSGQRLWLHTNSVRFSDWQGGVGPRATPTVAQGRVFTYGTSGILDCLEAETGRRVWSRQVLQENNLPDLYWGASCSPLVYDDTVVVTGGLTNGPTLLAYQRQTGQPLWRAGTDKASYASPVLVTLAGKRLVLSVNAASLSAHDPTTGKQWLNYPWATDKRPKAAQPVVLPGDRVFLSAGYNVGCRLLQVKAEGEERLTATELWSGRSMRNQFNTVAERNGFLYGLDDGTLACVDTATGERRWREGRYGAGQTLLVDDLILIQSEPGPVVLAESKPEGFQELARLPALSHKTWNYPVLAGRYLLVRNDQEAACYELPTAVTNGMTF